MRRHAHDFAVAAPLSVTMALAVFGQEIPAPQTTPTPSQAETPPAGDGIAPSLEELPWPVRLGARVAAVERAVPVADRVVLVPDAATFLDELSKWSLRQRSHTVTTL